MDSFDNISSSLGSISSALVWAVSRGRHGKLVDNFSRESDVTSLQDSFTSRPYKTTVYFNNCVPRKIRRGILHKTMVYLHLPFPTFLTSCLAVLATRNQFRGFLYSQFEIRIHWNIHCWLVSNRKNNPRVEEEHCSAHLLRTVVCCDQYTTILRWSCQDSGVRDVRVFNPLYAKIQIFSFAPFFVRTSFRQASSITYKSKRMCLQTLRFLLFPNCVADIFWKQLFAWAVKSQSITAAP